MQRLNQLCLRVKHVSNSNKDIILIRHAQSQFNLAEKRFADKKGIPNNFFELLKYPDFKSDVLYNIKYMDSPITQLGHQQCAKTRQILKNQHVDLVLVSPHLRALQTCHQIFKNKKVKVVLEPMLAEVFRFACDVSSHNDKKKQMFPDFNFERLDNQGLLWFLNVLQEHQRQKYLKGLDKPHFEKHEHKQEKILEMLDKQDLCESFQNLRNRMDKIRKVVQNYKKQGFKRIALVAHFHVIEWLLAEQFTQTHEPKPYKMVVNCQPYYLTYDEFMKKR